MPQVTRLGPGGYPIGVASFSYSLTADWFVFAEHIANEDSDSTIFAEHLGSEVSGCSLSLEHLAGEQGSGVIPVWHLAGEVSDQVLPIAHKASAFAELSAQALPLAYGVTEHSGGTVAIGHSSDTRSSVPVQAEHSTNEQAASTLQAEYLAGEAGGLPLPLEHSAKVVSSEPIPVMHTAFGTTALTLIQLEHRVAVGATVYIPLAFLSEAGSSQGVQIEHVAIMQSLSAVLAAYSANEQAFVTDVLAYLSSLHADNPLVVALLAGEQASILFPISRGREPIPVTVSLDGRGLILSSLPTVGLTAPDLDGQGTINATLVAKENFP